MDKLSLVDSGCHSEPAKELWGGVRGKGFWRPAGTARCPGWVERGREVLRE